ncbi:abkD, partial [Symbiodinium microadriaticum]
MFHADPHAGNVRLKVDAKAPGGARPVLLDWGLIREITDEERLGLAKVFHSLANFDIAGLFDVLESLGFSLKSELVNDTFKRDLIDKARGVVKDTVNRHKTRENAK